MATGVTSLEKTLIGVEALAGATTDIVTTHWRGMGKVKDRREIVRPPERVGKIGGTTRSYTPRTGSEVPLDGDATFEQLPYILNAGIYLATATTDTGSGYVRQWNVQAASSDPLATTDLGTLVVESGDNNDAEIARFVFIREFTIAGRQGEGMSIAAVGEGRDPSTATFTAVGTTDLENACETILFSKVSLFIDDSTGTMGNTQVSETILDLSHKHTTGWVALPARDGRLDFSNIKHVDDEIMTDMTWEHNANASTEKAKWRAQTERAVRIKWEGTALSSAGTYTYKTLQIDMVGKWQTFAVEGLEEQDGDNVVKGTFHVGSSSVGSAYGKCTYVVVNELATLP
jgi:hypothetical protein